MKNCKLFTLVIMIIIILSFTLTLVSCNYMSFKELKYYKNYNADNINKIYLSHISGPPRNLTIYNPEEIIEITDIIETITIKRVPYENRVGGRLYLQLFYNNTDYYYINIFCGRLTMNNKYYLVNDNAYTLLINKACELFDKYGIEPGYEEPVDY